MAFLIAPAFAAETGAPAATGDAAQQAPSVPYELSSEKMMMDNLFILAMLFFIFYFLLIRPQQRRLKKHQEVMKSLQKGNKVVTSGGLIGTIHKFEGEEVVVLEVAQNVRIRVARSAVSEVMENAGIGETANDN